VTAGVKAGNDDDTIMMELINAGVHVRDAWGDRLPEFALGRLANATIDRTLSPGHINTYGYPCT